jgi:hypothetical protein
MYCAVRWQPLLHAGGVWIFLCSKMPDVLSDNGIDELSSFLVSSMISLSLVLGYGQFASGEGCGRQ